VAYWIGTTGIHPKTLIDLETRGALLSPSNEMEPECAEEATNMDPDALKIMGNFIYKLLFFIYV